MNRFNQIKGCLLGGAIGDAWGSQWEGSEPSGSIDFDSPVSITDDTQLTLATCEAIIENEKVLPDVIAASMTRWFQQQRITGIGSSTLKALTELAAGGHWALVGRKGEFAAGNGAAMRVAPLAFLLDLKQYHDRQLLRDICRITHHSEEAYIGALAIVHAIQIAIMGNLNQLLPQVVDFIPDSRVRDRIQQLSQLDSSTKLKQVATEFGNSGYVVESVPFVLYAVQHFHHLSFREIFTQVIKSGGDTDTNASMTGQILGAFHGFTSELEALMNLMVDRKMIEEIAKKFVKAIV